MPRMSKVELYGAIRRDHRGGMSTRELERNTGVTWRTVRKAWDSSWPELCKKLPPRATGLDRYKSVIDEIPRADLDAPRKQRHTVTRLFHRPVEEHGADVSSMVFPRSQSSRRLRSRPMDSGNEVSRLCCALSSIRQHLPPSVAELQELRHLDLRENAVAEFPELWPAFRSCGRSTCGATASATCRTGSFRCHHLRSWICGGTRSIPPCRC